MIDLQPYVGKHVIVVFSAGNAWLASHVDEGKAALLVVTDENGKPRGFAPAPFLQGELVAVGTGHAVVVTDQRKNKMHVGVNPDHIVTITIAIEAPRVQLIG